MTRAPKKRKLYHPTLRSHLKLEDFSSLASELREWRTSETIKALEIEKGSGIVLGSVKGLRLSARLIYALRKNLSETALEVDWGHLIDSNQNSCSPECDIIIHQKGCVQRWNGSASPVMDFKFIDSSKAIAIVSCKSYTKSIKQVDKEYCRRLKRHVKNILYFAECCPPISINTLRSRARKAGYLGFWCLYSYDEDSSEAITQPDIWEDFLCRIKRICRS